MNPEEQHQHHEYPKLTGKLKDKFGLEPNLIFKMHQKIREIYSNSNLRNPVLSSQIHKIILDLFINEYYPLASRNIKTDNHTMAVIMGGTAYNMNIPNKMSKILYTPTDDIDMKIYTTDINKMNNVLSMFKYIIVIICFYMSQCLTDIVEYGRNSFEPAEPYVKRTQKQILNQSIKFNSTKTQIKSFVLDHGIY